MRLFIPYTELQIGYDPHIQRSGRTPRPSIFACTQESPETFDDLNILRFSGFGLLCEDAFHGAAVRHPTRGVLVCLESEGQLFLMVCDEDPRAAGSLLDPQPARNHFLLSCGIDQGWY